MYGRDRGSVEKTWRRTYREVEELCNAPCLVLNKNKVPKSPTDSLIARREDGRNSPAGMLARLVEQQLRGLSYSGRERKKLKGNASRENAKLFGSCPVCPTNWTKFALGPQVAGCPPEPPHLLTDESASEHQAQRGRGRPGWLGASECQNGFPRLRGIYLRLKTRLHVSQFLETNPPSHLPCRAAALSTGTPGKGREATRDSNENQLLKYK